MTRTLIPVLLLAAACAPQSADFTNVSYVSFFADGTSLSLAQGEIDPTDDRWDASYNVDCREFDTNEETNALKLEDPLKICGANWPPAHEEWAASAGYRVVSDVAEPWRGEAVITAEGDLQIGFHARMTGGADMRVILVVDPTFQPQTCRSKPGGGVERVDLDGNWLDQWSNELATLQGLPDKYQDAYAHMAPYMDNGRLYFLNSFAYQINPADVEDRWPLPEQWQAGTVSAKASEEHMVLRTTRYAIPRVYNLFDNSTTVDDSNTSDTDLWHCSLSSGEDASSNDCMSDTGEEIHTTADEIHDELAPMFKPDGSMSDPIFSYRPIAHLNDWRPSDGFNAGLDGWGEMHYNYVVFDGDSDLTAGGQATGAFSVVLDGEDSGSRLFVKGEFQVDKIRTDRWTTDDLQAIKAEENGAELCFL